MSIYKNSEVSKRKNSEASRKRGQWAITIGVIVFWAVVGTSIHQNFN